MTTTQDTTPVDFDIQVTILTALRSSIQASWKHRGSAVLRTYIKREIAALRELQGVRLFSKKL